MLFKNRLEAGKKLAGKLWRWKDAQETIVLGIPRGGVVVAGEIAKELNLPIDVLVIKKIGSPFNEEFAIGAIGNNVLVYGADLTTTDKRYIKEQLPNYREILQRRITNYGKSENLIDLKKKTVIIVDDGLATGLTMRAVVAQARYAKASKIIVAVPVASVEAIKQIAGLVDFIVYLDLPKPFWTVGQFYEEFEQVDDDKVAKILLR